MAGRVSGAPTHAVHYREADQSDIPAMARIRAEGGWEGGAPEERMARYLAGEHHPQQALAPRVIHVALDGDAMVGFVAGHLTRRLGCDGELQWIFVSPEVRGSGVAGELVRRLAAWFVERGAARICIDPGDVAARRFYRRLGAGDLNQHWMVWEDIGVVLRGRP